MSPALYRGRRAARLENDALRVTLLREGGHIAEILDKASGVSPLWTPPWPSIEPSTYERAVHPEYGGGVDASLLAGIMGHNLCLDIFGGPSDDEAAAGLPVHGEASLVRYELEQSGQTLVQRARLPLANLRVERTDSAVRPGRCGSRRRVENLSGVDRPVGWTEHVTLGPPFLEKGVTEFRASASRSKGVRAGLRERRLPRPGRRVRLARRASSRRRNCRPAALERGSSVECLYGSPHGPAAGHRFFRGVFAGCGLAFGYVWRRADFPWMGIWEENASRPQPPWNGFTLTRGMEFGASPFPETRREMIERGRLFDVPAFRWIPAATRVDGRVRDRHAASRHRPRNARVAALVLTVHKDTHTDLLRRQPQHVASSLGS